MAVQKSKKTRSKRNKRRNAHKKWKLPTLSTDSETGEIHRRHFITENGYYKGKQVFVNNKKNKKIKKTN